MLLRFNSSDRSGVRVELERTKKTNLVTVKELVEGETEVTRLVSISCLIVASQYMEDVTREYEDIHGVIFNTSWQKGVKLV
jgi:hypothetical protein